MKNLNFTLSNKDVDESDITAAENEIGFDFPATYRQFILSNNGGLSTECIFDIPNRGKSSVVFYGIHTGKDHSDLVITQKAYKHRLPDHVLPIGVDPGGNLICLAAEVGNEWKVYFWDHEQENSPPELSRMYKLANSFSEFIDSLQYEDNESW